MAIEARRLIQEFEDARMKNVKEYEAFADDLKEKIADFNERMTNNAMVYESLQSDNQALLEKVDIYEAKSKELEERAQNFDSIDKEEAI